MTIVKNTLSGIVYASEETGPDAPCVFTWSDGRTETHPKSWTGFFRGVAGGRNADGGEAEWSDGTGMNATSSVVSVFGSVGAYVAPEPVAEE